MTSMVKRAKQWARKAEALAARIGPAQSARDIERQSLAMWRDRGTTNLAGHSHAMGDDGIGEEAWLRIGRDAVLRFDAAAHALGWDGGKLHTLLDYGCGHGAQACAFAEGVPVIVGVDVQLAALDSALESVGGVDRGEDSPCDFMPVLIDEPEDVYPHVKMGYVDAFVSFYVFELLPGQELRKQREHEKKVGTMREDSYFIDPTTGDYRTTCPSILGRDLDAWESALSRAKERDVRTRWRIAHRWGEFQAVETTVTYRVRANPHDWDVAHGTNEETRAADMMSWLDNQAYEALRLPSDITGDITVNTTGSQPA